MAASGCHCFNEPLHQVRLDQCKRLYQNKQFRLALEQLEGLQEQYPSINPYEIALLMGKCRVAMGAKMHILTLNYLKKSQKSTKKQIKAASFAELGQLYYMIYDYGKAIDYFVKALDMPVDLPEIESIYCHLAIAYQSKGQWREADKYFTKCFESPDLKWEKTAKSRFGCKAFVIQLTTFDNAQQAREFVSKIQGNNIPVTILPIQNNTNIKYSINLYRMNDYKTAQEALKTLLKQYPEAIILPVP
ncbi:MAG: tetratricopeptide repeat protein [Phycisphaerae bacterium]|nr:tetratricopeptide repeat protein [Phycisphaerae bacterium]